MATWPSNFCPLIGSYQESPPDNIIVSSMDVGPAKYRRRTTADVRPISFSLFLKKDDVAVLDNFYVNEVFSGADEFDFTHPRTGVMHKARFTAQPQYRSRSIGYDVSIQLEIMP